MLKMDLEKELRKIHSKEWKVKKLEDKYNPVYLYNLISELIPEEDALKVTQFYEEAFYNPLKKLIKYKNKRT